MKKKSHKRNFEKLTKKYETQCSICHKEHTKDVITYTIFGYDENRKYQLTTGCCAKRIVEPIAIGLCGTFDIEDNNRMIRYHPMANNFQTEWTINKR